MQSVKDSLKIGDPTKELIEEISQWIDNKLDIVITHNKELAALKKESLQGIEEIKE